MPELPEVQTTVNGLQKKVLNRTFINTWSDWEKTIKKPKNFQLFKKQLKGKLGKRLIERMITSFEAKGLLPSGSVSNSELLLTEGSDTTAKDSVTEETAAGLIAKDIIQHLNEFDDYELIRDKTEDITLYECLQCLDMALDFETQTPENLMYNPFNPWVRTVFDISYGTKIETSTPTVAEETPVETVINYIKIYTIDLGKVQGYKAEGLVEDVHEDNRQVTCWVISENVPLEQLNLIEKKLLELHTKYLNYRFDACRSRLQVQS